MRFGRRASNGQRPSPLRTQPAPLPQDQQDEALRVWLGRRIGAPEAWRTRGATAGGLLSAAAAATFAGVFAVHPSVPAPAGALGVSAAVLYVVSVAGLLLAAVYPSPRVEPERTEDPAGWIDKYVESESRPIRRLVVAGVIVGGCAVALAGTSALLVVYVHVGQQPATIGIPDRAVRQAIRGVCPGIDVPFAAEIREVGSDRLALSLAPGVCGPDRRVLVIPRTELIVLDSDVHQ